MFNSKVDWCLATRCNPKTCMHGPSCPVIKENRFLFPISIVGLLFVIAIGPVYQHNMRAASMEKYIVPDRAVYSSWYSEQEDFKHYLTTDNQTQTLTLESSTTQIPQS